MAEVVLELVCGGVVRDEDGRPSICGVLLARFAVDADRPFDEQRGEDQTVPGLVFWRSEAPGMFELLPDAPKTGRYGEPVRATFAHPPCRSTPQARMEKFWPAVEKAMRYLHDTRTPLLRTTVDKLLTFRV